MPGALSHLRVLELSTAVAAAYCGRQFATWGAEVTAVEPPGGSPLRRRTPIIEAGGAQVSLLWEHLAAGKALVSLDPEDAADKAKLADALQLTDVLVTDWPARRLDGAGLGPASLQAANPGLVIVAISPFGEDGPYAAFATTELVVQALSGFISVNGVPEREPLKAAANLTACAAGVSAYVGALAALQERRRSGRGQVVEVSLLEAVASLVPLLRAEYSGADGVRQGGPLSGTFMFECKEGYISLNPVAGRNWDDLRMALKAVDADIPEELRGDQKPPQAVRAFIEERAKALPAREIFHGLNDRGIAAGLAMSPTDLLADPHLQARGYFAEARHPLLGHVRVPGPPARMSETPGRIREWNLDFGLWAVGKTPAGDAPLTPRPPLPQGARGSREGDVSDAESDAQSPNSKVQTPSALPLQGVRVLDLTAAWLGPYATTLLADLGADVIKIEALKRPDTWRGAAATRRPLSAPRGEHWTSHPANPDAHPWNTSANANSVNRNKRALCLDLTTPEGKDVFLRMARDADLVMENFTPRVMANFGLGYEVLREVNPRLVMVSYSGYGSSGPYRDYRANGAATDTNSGWAYLTGYAGGPPTMMGAMEADPISGLQMAATALSALQYREETGAGQHVEGSMIEACAGYTGEELLLAAVTGRDPPRLGNRDRQMAPHGVFPCAGDDAWVAIAVRDDVDWRALLSAITGTAAVSVPEGEVSLRDPRFATPAGRVAHAAEVEALVGSWTKGRQVREVMLALQAAGVPAGVVQAYSQVLDDPHLAARGWFQRITHADMGTHRYNGFPWRFSRTPAQVRMPPPRLGQDSAKVLTEVGLSAAEIEALVSKGVTGSVLAASDAPAILGVTSG